MNLLELMEFDGREKLQNRLGAALGLEEKLRELKQYRALALALTARYQPQRLAELTGVPLPPGEASTAAQTGQPSPAPDEAQRARSRANLAPMP